MRKPRILTKCVANHYAAPNERIVEVSAARIEAGCLISVRETGGGLVIHIYAADANVTVLNAHYAARV